MPSDEAQQEHRNESVRQRWDGQSKISNLKSREEQARGNIVESTGSQKINLNLNQESGRARQDRMLPNDLEGIREQMKTRNNRDSLNHQKLQNIFPSTKSNLLKNLYQARGDGQMQDDEFEMPQSSEDRINEDDYMQHDSSQDQRQDQFLIEDRSYKDQQDHSQMPLSSSQCNNTFTGRKQDGETFKMTVVTHQYADPIIKRSEDDSNKQSRSFGGSLVHQQIQKKALDSKHYVTRNYEEIKDESRGVQAQVLREVDSDDDEDDSNIDEHYYKDDQEHMMTVDGQEEPEQYSHQQVLFHAPLQQQNLIYRQDNDPLQVRQDEPGILSPQAMPHNFSRQLEEDEGNIPRSSQSSSPQYQEEEEHERGSSKYSSSQGRSLQSIRQPNEMMGKANSAVQLIKAAGSSYQQLAHDSSRKLAQNTNHIGATAGAIIQRIKQTSYASFNNPNASYQPQAVKQPMPNLTIARSSSRKHAQRDPRSHKQDCNETVEDENEVDVVVTPHSTGVALMQNLKVFQREESKESYPPPTPYQPVVAQTVVEQFNNIKKPPKRVTTTSSIVSLGFTSIQSSYANSFIQSKGTDKFSRLQKPESKNHLIDDNQLSNNTVGFDSGSAQVSHKLHGIRESGTTNKTVQSQYTQMMGPSPMMQKNLQVQHSKLDPQIMQERVVGEPADETILEGANSLQLDDPETELLQLEYLKLKETLDKLTTKAANKQPTTKVKVAGHGGSTTKADPMKTPIIGSLKEGKISKTENRQRPGVPGERPSSSCFADQQRTDRMVGGVRVESQSNSSPRASNGNVRKRSSNRFEATSKLRETSKKNEIDRIQLGSTQNHHSKTAKVSSRRRIQHRVDYDQEDNGSLEKALKSSKSSSSEQAHTTYRSNMENQKKPIPRRLLAQAQGTGAAGAIDQSEESESSTSHHLIISNLKSNHTNNGAAGGGAGGATTNKSSALQSFSRKTQHHQFNQRNLSFEDLTSEEEGDDYESGDSYSPKALKRKQGEYANLDGEDEYDTLKSRKGLIKRQYNRQRKQLASHQISTGEQRLQGGMVPGGSGSGGGNNVSKTRKDHRKKQLKININMNSVTGPVATTNHSGALQYPTIPPDHQLIQSQTNEEFLQRQILQQQQFLIAALAQQSYTLQQPQLQHQILYQQQLAALQQQMLANSGISGPQTLPGNHFGVQENPTGIAHQGSFGPLATGLTPNSMQKSTFTEHLSPHYPQPHPLIAHHHFPSQSQSMHLQQQQTPVAPSFQGVPSQGAGFGHQLRQQSQQYSNSFHRQSSLQGEHPQGKNMSRDLSQSTIQTIGQSQLKPQELRVGATASSQLDKILSPKRSDQVPLGKLSQLIEDQQSSTSFQKRQQQPSEYSNRVVKHQQMNSGSSRNRSIGQNNSSPVKQENDKTNGNSFGPAVHRPPFSKMVSSNRYNHENNDNEGRSEDVYFGMKVEIREPEDVAPHQLEAGRKTAQFGNPSKMISSNLEGEKPILIIKSRQQKQNDKESKERHSSSSQERSIDEGVTIRNAHQSLNKSPQSSPQSIEKAGAPSGNIKKLINLELTRQPTPLSVRQDLLVPGDPQDKKGPQALLIGFDDEEQVKDPFKQKPALKNKQQVIDEIKRQHQQQQKDILTNRCKSAKAGGSVPANPAQQRQVLSKVKQSDDQQLKSPNRNNHNSSPGKAEPQGMSQMRRAVVIMQGSQPASDLTHKTVKPKDDALLLDDQAIQKRPGTSKSSIMNQRPQRTTSQAVVEPQNFSNAVSITTSSQVALKNNNGQQPPRAVQIDLKPQREQKHQEEQKQGYEEKVEEQEEDPNHNKGLSIEIFDARRKQVEREAKEPTSLADAFLTKKRKVIEKLNSRTNYSQNKQSTGAGAAEQDQDLEDQVVDQEAEGKKEKTKQQLFELRKQMMKSSIKVKKDNFGSSSLSQANQSQHPSKVTPSRKPQISASHLDQQQQPEEKKTPSTATQVMARLAQGRKTQIDKSEMRKLTAKNYNNLPEIKKKREEEAKRQENQARKAATQEYLKQLDETRKRKVAAASQKKKAV